MHAAVASKHAKSSSTRSANQGWKTMTDITQLLDDHETFPREYAALDDADGTEQLRVIWEPLAALLDVHAKSRLTMPMLKISIPATKTRRATSARCRRRFLPLKLDC